MTTKPKSRPRRHLKYIHTWKFYIKTEKFSLNSRFSISIVKSFICIFGREKVALKQFYWSLLYYPSPDGSLVPAHFNCLHSSFCLSHILCSRPVMRPSPSFLFSKALSINPTVLVHSLENEDPSWTFIIHKYEKSCSLLLHASFCWNTHCHSANGSLHNSSSTFQYFQESKPGYEAYSVFCAASMVKKRR